MFFEELYLAASARRPAAVTAGHQPAMVKECLDFLQVQPAGCYVDGTCGCGGHSAAMAARLSPAGTLLCLDLDPAMVEHTRRRLRGARCRVLARQASFADLPEVLREEGLPHADGVLLDLGICSAQLDEAERGFSFQREGPLDMRYDQNRGLPASHFVNGLPKEQLATLLRDLVQEGHARAIAEAIAARRRRKPFRTTTDLAETIVAALPSRPGGRLHPATKVFLALRLLANDELGHLQSALERIPFVLSPGGRVVVLCYESLEDQQVKRAFRRLSGRCICPPGLPVCNCGAGVLLRVLTPKTARPSQEEVAANPRVRSARLRAAERRADA